MDKEDLTTQSVFIIMLMSLSLACCILLTIKSELTLGLGNITAATLSLAIYHFKEGMKKCLKNKSLEKNHIKKFFGLFIIFLLNIVYYISLICIIPDSDFISLLKFIAFLFWLYVYKKFKELYIFDSFLDDIEETDDYSE